MDAVPRQLRVLDYAVDDESVGVVLRSLAAGIKASQQRLEHVGEHNSDEVAEMLAVEENENLEALLGVAFISCQTWSARVTGAALHVAKECPSGTAPFTKPEEVHCLLPIPDCGYSKVELIFQLANYVKHRDEKPTQRAKWHGCGVKSQHTIDVIECAGLENGATDNLWRGAQALGLDRYDHLVVLEEIVRMWANEVRSELCKALSLDQSQSLTM